MLPALCSGDSRADLQVGQVKRIIGVPGDRIHLKNGVVYRNGQALDEPYVLHDRDNPDDHYRNDFPTRDDAHWRLHLQWRRPLETPTPGRVNG